MEQEGGTVDPAEDYLMVLPSSSVGNTGIPAAEQSTDANRRPERNELSCDDTPSSGLGELENGGRSYLGLVA